MKKIMVLWFVVLASCTTTTAPPAQPPAVVVPPVVAEPPKVETPKWVDLNSEWPNKAWDKLFIEAIQLHGKDMLAKTPADIKGFCPNYAKLNPAERAAFYLKMFSALARYESNFNPKATYTEGFADVKGKPVISAGIFQLSVESGNAYGCKLANTESLFDVKQNFNCAIMIANRWVGQRDLVITSGASPWKGMARYWSPYRKADKVNAIKAKTNTLQFCK